MGNFNINKTIEIISIFSIEGIDILEDTKLLDKELIDSINVIQIISEVENQYEIKIGPMDLSFDDFETPKILNNALNKL